MRQRITLEFGLPETSSAPVLPNLAMRTCAETDGISYRSYIREGKPVKHDYKVMIQEYKRGITSAKRDSWKNYCSEISDIKDIAKLVRCMSGKRNNEVGLIKDETGTYAKTPHEAISKMMDCHFPGSVGPDEATAVSNPLSTEMIDIGEVEEMVSEQKVIKAFHSFKSFKAPGADGIRPVFLKNLTPNIVGRITDLYKACLRLGYTPKAWREMKVIFIPKPGKVQYDDVKSFRPITLSSFLLKGLERIVLWQLLEKQLTDPLFNQYGFTRNRGTDMALSDVVDETEKTVLRGKYAIGCSLDIKGAFDFVEFGTIKDGLMVKGINKQVINWYDQLLRNRIIVADIKGCQVKRRPTRGTPQGGILSPVVWNVALDLLMRKFADKPIKPRAYADDIFVNIGGVDLSTMVCQMQKVINEIVEWGNGNNLYFNPGKTIAVIFTRRRVDTEKIKKIRVNGTPVEYTDKLKYLGVILDRRLNWSEHLDAKVKQAKQILMYAKALVGRTWGLNAKRVWWIYNAMVRPLITYGSVVWGHKTDNIGFQDKLSSVQRLAMMGMTQVMRTTPTKGLEVVLGILPLYLICQQVGVATWWRIRNGSSPNTWDGLTKYKFQNGHRRVWKKILDQIPEADMPTSKRDITMTWDHPTRVTEGFAPHIIVYTDGSKEDECTGAGWAVTKDDQVIQESHFGLGKYASVYQAELFAITDVCSWLLDADKVRGCGVLICSDSLSAVRALCTEDTNDQIVLDCRRWLFQLQNKCTVKLKWVRGHNDLTGNELADYLAKEGNKLVPVGPEPMMAIPSAVVKAKIKEIFMNLWEHHWHQEKSCRQTREFIDSVKERRTQGILNLSRNKLYLIVQFITGHCTLRRHLSLLQVVEDSGCRFCGECEETPLHVVNECPATWSERRYAFEVNEDKPWLWKLVKFVKSPRIERMFTV